MLRKWDTDVIGGPMDANIIWNDGIRIEIQDFSCNKLFNGIGKVTNRMRNISNEGDEDSVTNYIKFNNMMIFLQAYVLMARKYNSVTEDFNSLFTLLTLSAKIDRCFFNRHLPYWNWD